MKFKNVLLISAMTLSPLLVNGGQTYAATVGNTNSYADVTFTINDNSTVTPVDPGNPETPITPVDPHQPGTSGPLSIDYVSNLHFGSYVASGSDQVYYAQLDEFKKTTDGTEIKVPNFVQVTDNRGTNAGWNLTVSQNGQFSANEGANVLTGAQLKLSNPMVNSTNSMIYAPVASNVTLDPSGAAQDVVNASAGKGMGTWTTSYGSDLTQGAKSVSLSVPGSTAKVQDSQYTTSLTWTLTDAPL